MTETLRLEDAPLKVLLDTSVVQNLLTFGEYIFDNYLSEDLTTKPDTLTPEMKQDIDSLRNIFSPTTRSPVVPLISMLSLQELSGAPEHKRRTLLNWGFELLEYSVEVGARDMDLPTVDQTLLPDFLPNRIDRFLLGECKRMKCQAFITMDYKTILRFRDLIKKEGIRALSPSEWWSILKPWWALWV